MAGLGSLAPPFAAGNRGSDGLVLSVYQAASAGQALKSIQAVLDDQPVLDERAIQLALLQFFCPMAVTTLKTWEPHPNIASPLTCKARQLGRKIAKGAVARAVYSMDRPYDYLIPRELEERLRPGMRVLVPFAAGSNPAGLAGHHIHQLIAAGHFLQQVLHCGIQHHNKDSLLVSLLPCRDVLGLPTNFPAESHRLPLHDILTQTE